MTCKKNFSKQAGFAHEIVKAGFALSTSPFDVDIMRGVRMNIAKVFEKMKRGFGTISSISCTNLRQTKV
jgi:hypothetical protein